MAIRLLRSDSAPLVPPGFTILAEDADANNYSRFNSSISSLPYDISEASVVIVNVASDAGSTATVTIETAPKSTGPWFPVATITDPSAVGEQWSIPRQEFMRMTVVWTAGNVRGYLSAWRGVPRIY